eukprot:scaffold12674_cov123-Isochrysis_galbana.AAC.4
MRDEDNDSQQPTPTTANSQHPTPNTHIQRTIRIADRVTKQGGARLQRRGMTRFLAENRATHSGVECGITYAVGTSHFTKSQFTPSHCTHPIQHTADSGSLS